MALRDSDPIMQGVEEVPGGCAVASSGCCDVGPAASLAEQLKQVLAERERRLTGETRENRDSLPRDPTPREPRDPRDSRHAPPSPHHPDPVRLTDELVDEIRQAVSEANARGLSSPHVMRSSPT